MSTPINPQDYQVLPPAGAQQQAPPVQEAPQQPAAPAAPSVPIGDRQLTTDETIAMFRGTYGAAENETEDDEQSRMAGDFFAEQPGQAPDPAAQLIGPAAAARAPAAQQVAQWQQPIPQMTQEQLQAQQAQAPPAAAPNPELEALRAQNVLLQSSITQMQQQMTQLTAPQAAAAAQAALPRFNMQAPQQFLAGLNSDDPAQQASALNGLLNGVAETVATQMRTEFQQGLARVPEIVQPILTQRERANQIRSDMYGMYPELEPYRDHVAAAAQRLRPVYGDEWSPQLRDAIAEQVAPLAPGLYSRIMQNRATQMGAQAIQPQQYAPQQYAQPLPQYQNPQSQMPAGVRPVGVIGGTHQPMQPGQGGYASPPRAQQPMLVRDASGQLVQIMQPPQPYAGSSQVRPNGGQIDPMLADIWHTLNY